MRSERSVLIAPSCLLAALMFAAVSGGQQPSPAPAEPQRTPEQGGTIRAVSEEVLLDLIARDKHGRALRDLTPDEIEVYEDGVKQQITSFHLVEGEAPEVAGAPKGAASEVLRQVSLVTLVFERLGDDGRRNARQAALNFLRSELKPNVYAAVFVNDERLYILQRFTNDRSKLEQAVERATGGAASEFPSTSAGITQELEQEVAVATQLGAVAQNALSQASAGGAAGGSGPGVNAGSVGPAMAAAKMAEMTVKMLRTADLIARGREGRGSLEALMALIKEQKALPGRKTIIYYCEGLRMTHALQTLFDSVVSEANRVNVSVYAVDARGLVSSEVSAGGARRTMEGAESADHSGGGIWARLGETSGSREIVAGDSVGEQRTLANVQDPLRDLAESTGGFLVANTNEMGTAMRRIAEDIRVYYAVSYRPPARPYDGKFHRITVKLTRPGIKLQTRSGYYSFAPVGGAPVLGFEAPLLAALEAPPANASADYRVAALHYAYSDEGLLYHLVMEVPAKTFSFVTDEDDKSVHTHFSLLGLIKNAEGDVVDKFSQNYPLVGPADKMEALRSQNVVLSKNVRLKPGRYTLETVAFDQKTQKADVQRSVLVVPAASAGLSLSSVSVIDRADKLPPDRQNAEDPLQVQGVEITPNLGDPIAQSSSVGVPVYFVVYVPPATEKPSAELQFLRGGQLVAVAPVTLPDPDASGRISYLGSVSADRLEPGRYEIRALVRQGQARAVEYAFVSVKR